MLTGSQSMSNKEYTFKVLSPQGDFIKTLDPKLIDGNINWSRTVDSGFWTIKIRYYLSHKTQPIFQNQIITVSYKLQLLYRGYIADFTKEINATGEYWEIEVIGYQAKLNSTPYMYGGDYTFTRTAEVSVILKEIINDHNTQRGTTLFDPDSIEPTDLTISLEFDKNNSMEAIKNVIKNIGYIIDFLPDGTFMFKKPEANIIDHALVFGKHITQISQKYKTNGMCNKITLTYDDWVITDENTISINRNELLWKPITDLGIKDITTAELRIQSELARWAEPINQITLTVVDEYDLESLQIGDTVAIKNYSWITYGLTRQDAEALGYTRENLEVGEALESTWLMLECLYQYITKIDYGQNYSMLSLGDYESLSKSLNNL